VIAMAQPLVWLADVLRAAGLRVVETEGWRERAARGQRPNPGGDGNTTYVGFEWDYAGTQPPSREQYAAAVRANAAVLQRLRRGADAARGHKETSVTGKWDPGHVDMDGFRRDVAAAMNAPAPAPMEDDLTPEESAILRRIENELLGPRGEGGRIQGWGTEIGPRTMVAMLVELTNALLAPKPSRVPGAEKILAPWSDIDRDTNAVVFQLPALINAVGKTDPAAVAEALRPVIAEAAGPVIREAVADALGDDNEGQADAIVTALAARLAGQEAAA